MFCLITVDVKARALGQPRGAEHPLQDRIPAQGI